MTPPPPLCMRYQEGIQIHITQDENVDIFFLVTADIALSPSPHLHMRGPQGNALGRAAGPP